ncbi:hypothetical protein PDJAM_G00246810 [Pangasius djambal]|uniref:Uncharacterized protein n=1 Tax=Pangasius djambal TaxID=1691987 RepID=A0ACC5YK32_9TELE|nr:hypothetical protein [Pangasius djambal]
MHIYPPSMEVKEERADGREVREAYTMLVESDAIVRKKRTLRREMCISRTVIFLLLSTCMAFCVILYVQQDHASKNKESKEKANETCATFQTGNAEARKVDDQTPPMASLSIHPNSTKPILTWQAHHRHMNDFCLKGACESLIIPQDGKYRLGLQITYGEENPKEEQIDLAHYIVMYSDSYKDPMTILSVHETVYKKRTWYKSVFSEVIYVFSKGDRVKVQSDNAKLIDRSGQVWTKNFLTFQFVSKIREL